MNPFTNTNLGTTDRVIRLILGAILLATAILGGVTPLVKILFVVLALIAVSTGSIKFCPLYRLLGISTFKTQQGV